MRGTPAFSSLRHRNFRLLWIGTITSNMGDSMDQVALNWVILELTGSPLHLGLFNLSRAVPMLLLSLVGGVAADRVERRRLLMITQGAAMLLAFAIALLISLGTLQLWQVYVLGVLRGITMSFNMPARQSIISELVPSQDLSNAIAVNLAGMQVTKVLGPSLAGILIAVMGTSSPFYINGLSFLAVLYSLYAMDLPRWRPQTPGGNLLQDVAETFAHLKGSTVLRSLLLVALVPYFFGQPYQTMITVFARDVLAVGPTGLGLLTSAAALGGILGAGGLAFLGDFQRKGAFMMLSLIVFGFTLVFFSFSQWAMVSALALVGVGAASSAYKVINNTLVQLMAPQELRGRVMSLVLLDRGMVPLGTALAGVMASSFGVPLTMGAMAAVVIVLAIIVSAKVPQLWQLE